MSDRVRQAGELPPAKRRLFILVSLLLPLLAVAAIEMLLRLAGYGGYDLILREMEDTPLGKLVITDQAGARDFFFANPGRPGFNRASSFYAPKADNKVRIVLLGGSVIKGFPQTRRFAVDSFLREMLGDAWPDKTVEVINLGTTAVASFPVREFLRQALVYEPDLVVVLTGHNEFYGAYGVASSNEAGSTPGMLQLQYHIRGLAIVQGLARIVQLISGVESHSMMEIMVGTDYVEPGSWQRDAAANLLYEHVGSMIKMGHASGVPVVVCMLPSNERDLAPIGSTAADTDGDGAIAMAKLSYSTEPESVMVSLRALLSRQPDHASAHFYLGKAYFASGDHLKAHHHFVRARDLDPMPWRATSASQLGVRRAVTEQGAQLCEAEEAFRRHSPGGSIGWELMDDHVHPSLHGQALLARTIVETLSSRTDGLRVSRKSLRALPDFNHYAQRLGDNPFDRYGVAHTLRTLFTVPFMQQSNPEALRRFNKYALSLEGRMTPAIRDIAWQWQSHSTHPGAWQPISGMIAHGMLDEKRYTEALALYDVARHSVPLYSQLNIEYEYYWLHVRQKLIGELTAADRDVATLAIQRGGLLFRREDPQSGEIEQYLEGMRRLTGSESSAPVSMQADWN